MTDKRVVKEEPIPEEWRNRQVGLLDALLYARQQLLKKRGLWFVTGFDTIESLVSFIAGWASNTQFNQGSDPEWEEFWDWLRDVKKEMPPEGWHVKYLRDCDGDHERAALKFLDFVQEFIELRRRPSAQS
ncbi:hypothetical protein [Melittangium boletus]|uniref:Uncharacterized protein n=1 Tax=Melittangium boletus DSM 14713 TaxID=1294270 RepID=A0A250ITM2_9BACT|nr:hypothetical protein [Melittangium boletus]ATB34276.1 hypothetical protein MEBOL_007777 [Melittangium boletus DSM 14713]